MIMTLSDFDIQALVDNELDGERTKIVQYQLNLNPQLKRRHEELLRQKKTLQSWWEAIRQN